MSPLIFLLFAVVNNSIYNGQDRMNAYIWKEFDGDCVQNIITSFLLMDFKNRVSLIPPNYGELTCIANNFGGQNKNM